MPKTTFGKNIKAIREDLAQMTQQEFADAIGVIQGTVSGWETREISAPRSKEITERICERFRVTPQDLFGISDGYYSKAYGAPGIKAVSSVTYAPVVGNVAAGDPRDALESGYEKHWINPDVLEAYPDGFFLRISGDSMNLALPDGSFAYVAPGEVSSGDIAVVKVNGDEATVKRVKLIDGLVILEPESSNPEHKRRVIDETDPDAPEVRIIGRVVWADFNI